MPCSTCATNVLQRFLGGFEIFVSKTAGRPPTRHFYSTGARQFYNARSTPRRTSKNPRYVEPSEHLDLKILRQTSTPPLEPALAKEEEQEETDEDSHRVEVAVAVDEHGQRAKSEQQQTHRKDSNSLDRSWWEEHYSSDLRKSNRTPSQPGASSPPSASHPRTRSPSTPTTTKNAPSSPSEPTPSNPPKPRTGPSPWQIQKAALATKFPTGWIPRKRLSPDTLDGIRTLHAQYPLKYTTPVLASQFKVSPEAIRRILKSKWRPSDEEEEERVKRWENRGKSIWEGMAEVGLKPPRKWREMGVRKRVGVGRGEARRWGENRGERRRREREGESGADGGRGEGVGERGKQARGKSKDVTTAFTLKGIPAIEAVRPGLVYQVPLADRIL